MLGNEYREYVRQLGRLQSEWKSRRVMGRVQWKLVKVRATMLESLELISRAIRQVCFNEIFFLTLIDFWFSFCEVNWESGWEMLILKKLWLLVCIFLNIYR